MIKIYTNTGLIAVKRGTMVQHLLNTKNHLQYQVAKNKLKITDRGIANSCKQFFNTVVGVPSGAGAESGFT